MAEAPTNHVPTNVDDGDSADISYFPVDTDASPVLCWLAAFAPDESIAYARVALRKGMLDPVLTRKVISEALGGCGITVSAKKSWNHIDAILSTPIRDVFVGVSLDDPPGKVFKLGFRRGADDAVPAQGDVAQAVRATMRHLRTGLSTVPEMPPVPSLRPFRSDVGYRSFAQIAALKGVAVDPEGALGVDRFQEAANAESRAMSEAMKSGTIDAEAAYERGMVGKREWLIQAHGLVGAEAVTAILGDDAVPRDPPPEAPGWPYWLRSTVVQGREKGPRKDSFHLMEAIQQLCRTGGYSAIDAAYRRLDVSAISEMAMITLLRTPFMGRENLQEWGAFRERVREEMFARGMDGDKVLIGLGKPNDVDADADAGGPPPPAR